MLDPSRQFQGERADGSGKAVIDVGPLPTAIGIKVSISSEEGWPEMLLTPREAVKLAAALLRIAAPDAGTARQVKTGWTSGDYPSDQPGKTIWLFNAEL